MKKFLRKLLPESAILFYHRILARFAALVYGMPSKKMVIIGVTGTKGKTSTINYIWSVLQAGGIKTGIISTANIRIGNEEVMNKYHMTMPGRFTIQKLLSQMAKSGCKYCIVETTSEGIKQSRHIGIWYDIGVFTNLTPEHLPSHGGSFENYKNEKLKMFRALSSHKKMLDGKQVEKLILANADDEHAKDVLAIDADEKFTFSLQASADYQATELEERQKGVHFTLMGEPYDLSILGTFNVYNALPAIIIGKRAGVDVGAIQNGVSGLKIIPGRMEEIKEGQDFNVLVDYAHEKISMTWALEAVQREGAKTIVLLGAEGGGRDTAKRPVMGEIAGRMADFVVVSNVDPYDDDPTPICEEIAVAAEAAGKVRDKELFVIEDRREGIRKALKLAGPGDTVLITGKGAEQSIIIDGKSSPWDDREVVREELRKLGE